MQAPTTAPPVSTMEATKILLVVLLAQVSKGFTITHKITVHHHHTASLSAFKAPESTEPSESEVNATLAELRDCPNPKSHRCDGPWTIIQRRVVGGVSFNRSWEEYKWGFPSHHDGDFWLGLEYLHRLTEHKPYSLRVKMTDEHNIKAEANYDSIRVDSEEHNYTLHLGRWLPYPLHNCCSIESMMERFGEVHGGSSRCNARDGLRDSDGLPFSTFDKDHDLYDDGSCAERYGAGFWFSACFYANPNGHYRDNREAMGIVWDTFRPMDHSLTAFEMAIKPTH